MRNLAFGFLWIFIFLVPAENIATVRGVGTLAKITAILALATGLVALFERQGVRRLLQFHLAMALFLIWGLASYTWSIAPELTADRLQTVLLLGVMVWLIWEMAPTRERRESLIRAYVVGATLTASSIFAEYFTGHAATSGRFDRFTAFEQDPNKTALVLCLGIPFAWYAAVSERRRLWSWGLRLYVPLASAAILLTGSRSGFLALLVALSFIPLSLSAATTRRKVALFFLVVIGGWLIFQWAPPDTVGRLATIADEVAAVEAGAEGSRIGIWKSGYSAFLDNPITGVGLGAFRNAVSTLNRGWGMAPHNSFVAVLVEQGLVGLFLFLWILWLLVRVAWRLPRLEKRLFLVLLATWSMSVLFIQQDYKKHTWFVFSMIIAAGSDREGNLEDSDLQDEA